MDRLSDALRHPCYEYFKEIVERHSTLTYRPIHLLECLIFILFILRCFTFQLALYLNTNHLPFDPLGSLLFSKRQLYDTYFIASVIFFSLYGLINNCLLFFSQNSTTSVSWQSVAYDLMVRNIDQANDCRLTDATITFGRLQRSAKYRSKLGLVLYFILRPFNTLFTKIISTLKLDFLDQKKWHHQKLVIFHFFFRSLREQCLKLQIIADWTSNLFQRTALIFLAFCLTAEFLTQVVATFPLGNFRPVTPFLLVLDVTLVWAHIFLNFRNAFLLLYYTTLTSIAYRVHLGKGHSTLAYLSAKYRSFARHQPEISSGHLILLKNFLAEQTRITQIIDTTNRQIISRATFSAIASYSPVNIYIIYRLIYRQLDWIDIAISLNLIFTQLVFLVSALVPLAQTNEALYQTIKYLPQVQHSVFRGKRFLRLKLQYETLHSCLTEGRLQSGTSIGPVCLVTFETLYQALCLYAVYLLCFFTLLPK